MIVASWSLAAAAIRGRLTHVAGDTKRPRVSIKFAGIEKGRQSWQKSKKHRKRQRALRQARPAAKAARAVTVGLDVKADQVALEAPADLAVASANISAKRKSASFVSKRWT